MPELSHLSYSSISAYQSCGRAWRFKYIDKIATLPTPALIFGSAFHATIEHFIRARVANETPAITDLWKEKWGAAKNEPIQWNNELPEQLENDGLRMLGNPETTRTIEQISPLIENGEPVIEKRVELHIPGVPIPVIGFIDLITTDGVACDFKTAARSWTQDQAANEIQPIFYLAALSQAGYKVDYRFRHLVFVKTKTPQTQTLESSHHPASLFWLFEAVKDVWKGIDANVFPPNPGSWKCSPKFCDAWQLCRGKR